MYMLYGAPPISLKWWGRDRPKSGLRARVLYAVFASYIVMYILRATPSLLSSL